MALRVQHDDRMFTHSSYSLTMRLPGSQTNTGTTHKSAVVTNGYLQPTRCNRCVVAAPLIKATARLVRSRVPGVESSSWSECRMALSLVASDGVIAMMVRGCEHTRLN